jgi:hypothetical protein
MTFHLNIIKNLILERGVKVQLQPYMSVGMEFILLHKIYFCHNPKPNLNFLGL